MAVKPHGQRKPARRSASGYLPYSVDPPRIELGSPPRSRRRSSRWTMSPYRSVDRPGNRTPISWLQARHLPVGRAAHVQSEVRLGIEPSLPLYQSGVQPQHLQTTSDPGWNRTITFLHVTQVSSPLDHGIKLSVTEVGVEPTGTRLSTSSLCQFAYPVIFQ